MLQRHQAGVFALLALLFGALVLSSCDRGGPETQEEIVARLRSNADTFEYATGTYGGTITYATVSEPLTFNLVLANDAGSSGYLSYVFEGLTETSWLNDEIEPALAESWERSDDGLEWTFHLPAGRLLARRRAVHRARRGFHVQSHHLQRRYPHH